MSMSRRPLALAAVLLLLAAAFVAVAPPLAVEAAGVDDVSGGGEFGRAAATTMSVGADPKPAAVDGVLADPSPDGRV
uniref:Uncharacterized protein n=1 Tax=Leersia perrieri TaxID=77586 RepID=A0A0D9XEU4_9ORYZ